MSFYLDIFIYSQTDCFCNIVVWFMILFPWVSNPPIHLVFHANHLMFNISFHSKYAVLTFFDGNTYNISGVILCVWVLFNVRIEYFITLILNIFSISTYSVMDRCHFASFLLSLMSLKIFFYYSRVALYCCISFCCRAKWISHKYASVQFSRSVMSDSVTPWTAACQTSMSITSSWSLLKLMPIESVMPSIHPSISSSVIPFSSCLQSFPKSGSFPRSQSFASGGQSIGVSV